MIHQLSPLPTFLGSPFASARPLTGWPNPLGNPWLAPSPLPLDQFSPSPGLGSLLALEGLFQAWLMMASGSPAAAPGVKSRPEAEPMAQPTQGASGLGMQARNFRGSQAGGWGGLCLSWVRNATEWAAGKKDHGIPLLNAASAEEARQKAARAGILRQGNPPPGAIIYFKPGTYGMNSQYGHIAIANPDGKSFHGSSSAFHGQEVGDMSYPPGAKAHVYWTMPEWLIHPERAH